MWLSLSLDGVTNLKSVSYAGAGFYFVSYLSVVLLVLGLLGDVLVVLRKVFGFLKKKALQLQLTHACSRVANIELKINLRIRVVGLSAYLLIPNTKF